MLFFVVVTNFKENEMKVIRCKPGQVCILKIDNGELCKPPKSVKNFDLAIREESDLINCDSLSGSPLSGSVGLNQQLTYPNGCYGYFGYKILSAEERYYGFAFFDCFFARKLVSEFFYEKE